MVPQKPALAGCCDTATGINRTADDITWQVQQSRAHTRRHKWFSCASRTNMGENAMPDGSTGTHRMWATRRWNRCVVSRYEPPVAAPTFPGMSESFAITISICLGYASAVVTTRKHSDVLRDGCLPRPKCAEDPATHPAARDRSAGIRGQNRSLHLTWRAPKRRRYRGLRTSRIRSSHLAGRR